MTGPPANKKDNAREGSQAPSSKDGDDLDQVTGNAEDDIGDRVQNIRENEMLYGEKSLLALYGGMIVHICQSPNKYKVSQRYFLFVTALLIL